MFPIISDWKTKRKNVEKSGAATHFIYHLAVVNTNLNEKNSEKKKKEEEVDGEQRKPCASVSEREKEKERGKFMLFNFCISLNFINGGQDIANWIQCFSITIFNKQVNIVLIYLFFFCVPLCMKQITQ